MTAELDAGAVSWIVLQAFGLAALVALALCAVGALVLEFLPPVPCSCPTGCGACEDGLRRWRKRVRVGRRVLAGVLVLAAFALLASALAGCRRTSECSPGWHAESVNCRVEDCGYYWCPSTEISFAPVQFSAITNTVETCWPYPSSCTRCDRTCVKEAP